MKLAHFFLFLGFLFFSNFIFAGNGGLFKYDKNKVNYELRQLNELEQSLYSQYGPISEQTQSFLFWGGINQFNYNFAPAQSKSTEATIPPFLTGCLMGPFGFIYVITRSEDKKDNLYAFLGCLISSPIYISAAYVVYYNLFVGY